MEERKEAALREVCVLIAGVFIQSALVDEYLHVPLSSFDFAVVHTTRLHNLRCYTPTENMLCTTCFRITSGCVVCCD